MSKADARGESLAIPDSVREAVDRRDGTKCRMCGKHLGDRRALHHVLFGGDLQGMGGRREHDPDAIVTICWLPGDPKNGMRPCHEVAHNKKLYWQKYLLECCQRPGITAMQLARWDARRRRVASSRG